MRALFHYDPHEDRAIPCQEAGLPFQCRQVLEVVSQDDPTWWQAKRLGDTNLRAGLIPSKQFQERWVGAGGGWRQSHHAHMRPVLQSHLACVTVACRGWGVLSLFFFLFLLFRSTGIEAAFCAELHCKPFCILHFDTGPY